MNISSILRVIGKTGAVFNVPIKQFKQKKIKMISHCLLLFFKIKTKTCLTWHLGTAALAICAVKKLRVTQELGSHFHV